MIRLQDCTVCFIKKGTLSLLVLSRDESSCTFLILECGDFGGLESYAKEK